MADWLIFGAGCALVSSSLGEPKQAGDGWTIQVNAEYTFTEQCDHVDVRVPERSWLQNSRLKLTPGRKLSNERMEVTIDAMGNPMRRIHHAGLPPGRLRVQATFRRNEELLDPQDPPPLAQVSSRTQLLTLAIPQGANPQVALYPGWGSSWRRDDLVEVPPDNTLRRVDIPISANAEVEYVNVQPDPVAIRYIDGHIRVLVANKESPASIAVRTRGNDAPTFGAAPADTELTIRASGADVRWEPDHSAWWLAGWKHSPIMPNRESLVVALEHRFAQAARREPSIPMSLRGIDSSFDVAAALLTTLRESVVETPWPTQAVWPRPLGKVVQDGAASPLEAALILTSWCRQVGLQADWALIHPGPNAPTVSPHGYTQAAVRVQHNGEAEWMVPFCDACVHPFQLPDRWLAPISLGPAGPLPDSAALLPK